MVRHDEEVVPANARAESRSQADAAPARLFSRVREALFESTHAVASAPARREPEQGPEQTALTASARDALRELVSRQIGPALAEFNLQLEALQELVPDSLTRYRIALSVLAKKQITEQALQEDLKGVATRLEEQLQSLAQKVEARRREQAEQATRIDAEFATQRTRSEREIAALEAALAKERSACDDALAERDRRLAELSVSADELARKEHAFRSAQSSLLGEYQELMRALYPLLREKS